VLCAAVSTCCCAAVQGHEYGLRVSSKMDRLAESYELLICAANKLEDRWGAEGRGHVSQGDAAAVGSLAGTWQLQHTVGPVMGDGH
jgi:poly(3-hydroxybutyrate) depolymerase